MNVVLRSIELFAGAGGLALGLGAVGVRTVCYVEREAYAAAILAARMEEGELAPAPVWSDVQTFDGRPWRGVVDLVAGGFPCQDISYAGKGAGIGGRRSGLWREFARIIGEVRPTYVFVENVAALRSRGLDIVLGDLASLGYDAEWGVFRASDVGAPHRRERLFILAHASGFDGGERERLRLGAAAGAGGESRTEIRSDGVEYSSGKRRPEGWASHVLGRGRNASPDAGKRLGNADKPGLARRSLRGGERADSGTAGPTGSSMASWPPGPQDADGWRAYLARWPGLEPALRRGADGLAHRVDRLRVLGNGVVPDQAALAWRVLRQRLMEAVR